MKTFPIVAQSTVMEHTPRILPRKKPPTCFKDDLKPPPSLRMYTAKKDEAVVPQQVPQPKPTDNAADNAVANIRSAPFTCEERRADRAVELRMIRNEHVAHQFILKGFAQSYIQRTAARHQNVAVLLAFFHHLDDTLRH